VEFDPEKPRRRSIRLAGYDYTEPGVYFVTVCVQGKKCLFGQISAGEMQLNRWGKVAVDCWQAIPMHFMNVELDAFIVMPNHVHGILVITETPAVGATHASPARDIAGGTNRATHASPLRGSRGPKRGSVGAMVGAYKSAVTKRINAKRRRRGVTWWQRNYYEHVIRDDAEWNLVREYIVHNPECWGDDAENPSREAESGIG